MLQQGVIIGGCGENTVRIRTSLTFNPKHVAIMMEKFNDVLKALS